MATNWAAGSNGTVRLIRETTFGTTPTPAADGTNVFCVPFNTCDLTINQPVQKPATITGTRNPSKGFRGNKDCTGSIVVPMDLRAIGLWLKLLFGEPTTTGTGPYTHVFKILSELPSYSIEKGFTDIDDFYLYAGVKASNFSLTFGGDGELTMSIGLNGASETHSDASIAEDTSDETDWVNISTRLYNSQGTLSVAGGSLSPCVTEFTLNFDNGLESAYCIGSSGEKSKTVGGQVSVNGSITAIFDDDTLLAYGRADTETSLLLTITSGSYSIAFDIGESLINYNSPGITGPAGVYQTLDYEAYYEDDDDASALKVTLVNDFWAYSDTAV